MKNKKGFAVTSFMVIVVLGGVTVFGASELRTNNSNNKTQLAYNRDFEDMYRYENSYSSYSSYSSLETAEINGNIQEITTNLEPSTFPAIVVQKNVPLKWTMIADEINLNYCNNEIVIPSLNIEESINIGENVIQFTPTESGVIPYSCWMGMVSSAIIVVDDIDNYDKTQIEAQLAQIPKVNCCGLGGRRR